MIVVEFWHLCHWQADHDNFIEKNFEKNIENKCASCFILCCYVVNL